MKKRFKGSLERFGQYLEFNQKAILTHFGIFFLIVIGLLLIDLLTKQFLFRWDGDTLFGVHQGAGPNAYDHKNAFFGIRSISNPGLTVFGTILPTALIHFFNFIILFVCFAFLLVIRSKVFIVAIAFLSAGTLGNMIDRFAFSGYVRDIIFLPWLNPGSTFNLADVQALFGVSIAVFGLIYHIIVGMIKNNRSQQ